MVALLAGVLTGCATITTHKRTGEEMVMTREEFEHYVEHVFRYHNQVMSELIESAEERTELSAAEARQFSAAEMRMNTACEPLNEVVSETLSGENVGLQLKLELVDAVPACEEASKVVDDLMP